MTRSAIEAKTTDLARRPALQLAAMAEAPGGTTLVVRDLPSLPLRAREVRVAVKAVGVNPVDSILRGIPALRLVHWLLGPPGPFVCGIDFAGVVTEVGPAAQGVAVGDAVVGAIDFSRRQHGSYATEVVVRDIQVALLPAHVDLNAAACLPIAGVTAHLALFEKGGLGAIQGGKVLVLGASGGVGHLALQLARNHGARVVGVCSARNAPFVRRLGATPIAHDESDPLEAAAAHGPFDVVVNAVDTKRYPVGRVARLLARRGRQVLLKPRLIDFPKLLRPGATTFNTFPTRATLEPLVQALADGELEVTISQCFRLEQAEQAQQLSRTGRVVGKLVLTAG